MGLRYDNWVDMHNPTSEEFIGRWELESYPLPAGSTIRFPAWLSRHFAKRLADREMIKLFGVPLRAEDDKRKDFIAKCLSETIDVHSAATISTKQQIEQDRVETQTAKVGVDKVNEEKDQRESLKAKKEVEKEAEKEIKADYKKEGDKIKKGQLITKTQKSEVKEDEKDVEAPQFEGDANKASLGIQQKIKASTPR